METSVKILAKDGILRMAFTPALDPQQYDRLMELVQTSGTVDGIKSLVAPWAVAQGLVVVFGRE